MKKRHSDLFIRLYNIGKWKILLAFLIFSALVFLARHIVHTRTQTSPILKKVVEVEVLKKGSLRETIRLIGTIHPKHTTLMTAKGNGILDTLIPTGHFVKKGTLIAKIDNPEQEKHLELSIHNEIMAKNQYERLDSLFKKGYISSTEMEEKKQHWITSQKNVSSAKIALDNLRFYAPFDGVIGAWKKREGSQISQGEAVVSIYDPNNLTVDFDIPCSNIYSLKTDQSVYIAGKRYTLSNLQKMLDDDTHMCPADVDIHCEDCLMGTTIDIDLVLKEKKHIVSIPFQALFLKKSLPFVYVVREGKIAMLSVKTGIKQQDRIEITEGLQPGDQLVTRGQERLAPDMQVVIHNPANQMEKT